MVYKGKEKDKVFHANVSLYPLFYEQYYDNLFDQTFQ